MRSRFAAFWGFRPLRSGHIQRVSPVVCGLLMAVCIGGLAGCGAGSGVNGGGGVSSTATPTMKAAVKGCPIGTGGAVDVGTPTLVLTITDANHESKAHVGDVIQVRLPATQRWTLDKEGAGILEMLQPAGYWDASASACIWNFRAAKVGATTVSFVGMALCEPKVPCPQYAIYEQFLVTVV